VNQQLRTTTVLALCRQMLDARDFEAVPILADALQDAGCTDEALLRECRDPKLEPVLAERLVNLVYSDETAAAVRWLEKFARDVGYEDDPPMYDYEIIVDAGREAIEEGEYCWGTDAGAEFFYEEENRREFFRNWSLVTGVPVAEDVQEKIGFRCAC
jgi:hypothetical protein